MAFLFKKSALPKQRFTLFPIAGWHVQRMKLQMTRGPSINDLGWRDMLVTKSGLRSCFHPCLFVREQDISKLVTDSDKIWWTGWVYDKDKLMRFWWRSGSGHSNSSNSSPFWYNTKNNIITWYLKKLWTIQRKLGGHVGFLIWTNWFDFGEDLKVFFQWFFTIYRWGQKRYMAWYLKKLWMDYDKSWWISWGDDNNKLIRFWLRPGCRSGLQM